MRREAPWPRSGPAIPSGWTSPLGDWTSWWSPVRSNAGWQRVRSTVRPRRERLPPALLRTRSAGRPGMRFRFPAGVGSGGFQPPNRSGDFLVADRGAGGTESPLYTFRPLHYPAAESNRDTEEQAARKPPGPVGDKKVAPPAGGKKAAWPSGRQESRPSSRRQESRLARWAIRNRPS